MAIIRIQRFFETPALEMNGEQAQALTADLDRDIRTATNAAVERQLDEVLVGDNLDALAHGKAGSLHSVAVGEEEIVRPRIEDPGRGWRSIDLLQGDNVRIELLGQDGQRLVIRVGALDGTHIVLGSQVLDIPGSDLDDLGGDDIGESEQARQQNQHRVAFHRVSLAVVVTGGPTLSHLFTV